MKIALLLALVVLSLCGCGQKGPLYLPQAELPPEPAPTNQPVENAPSPQQ
jgi:predicted small lipoprotein YifL